MVKDDSLPGTAGSYFTLSVNLFDISRYKGKEKQRDWNNCELGANIPSCC